MKQLPSNVTSYKRTPIFTQDSIPDGLLHDHSTKEGTWGLIKVIEGILEYNISGIEKHILSPEKHGVIEPKVLHYIKPLRNVSFFIEFYK